MKHTRFLFFNNLFPLGRSLGNKQQTTNNKQQTTNNKQQTTNKLYSVTALVKPPVRKSRAFLEHLFDCFPSYTSKGLRYAPVSQAAKVHSGGIHAAGRSYGERIPC
jgi:hypothetical protein